MCCTKSPRLLGNSLARRALGFTPPAGHANFRPFDYNETIVWDIDNRGFRTVSCDRARVVDSMRDEDYMRSRGFIGSK